MTQDLKDKVTCHFDQGSVGGDVSALVIRKGADVLCLLHGHDAEVIMGMYEELQEREAKLVSVIRKTLEDNGHLADGDNCTLIDLKNILKELGIDV